MSTRETEDKTSSQLHGQIALQFQNYVFNCSVCWPHFFFPLLYLLICFLSSSPAREHHNSSCTLLVIALFKCEILSTSEDSPSEANSLPAREIFQCLQHTAYCLPYDTPIIMLQTPFIQLTTILNA